MDAWSWLWAPEAAVIRIQIHELQLVDVVVLSHIFEEVVQELRHLVHFVQDAPEVTKLQSGHKLKISGELSQQKEQLLILK